MSIMGMVTQMRDETVEAARKIQAAIEEIRAVRLADEAMLEAGGSRCEVASWEMTSHVVYETDPPKTTFDPGWEPFAIMSYGTDEPDFGPAALRVWLRRRKVR